MTAGVLTDILGMRQSRGRVWPADARLERVLADLVDVPLHWLTDWGPDAVSGVCTVAGRGAAAVATLEKQLREQGDTDEVSHLLVHESRALAGSTMLAFTAVPMSIWRHHQQLAVEQPALVLMHDWTRTLLAWAKNREWTDGPVVVLTPGGVDVLILERSSLQAVERFKAHGEKSPERWAQLGQRACAFIQSHAAEHMLASTSTGEQGAPAHACLALVLGGAEPAAVSVFDGLAPCRPIEAWAEQAQALNGVWANTPPLHFQAFDLQAVLADQPVQAVASRALDTLSWLADRWVGRVGVAACLVSVALLVAAQLSQRQTQARRSQVTQTLELSKTQLAQLQAAVSESEQLGQDQRELREWLQKRIAHAQVPDMSDVLARVRGALPPATVIDEVGLVVQDGAHLVTVIGQVGSIEDSLRVESQFVNALRETGFEIRQRDVLLRNGQPKFKLSLTWSRL